MHAHEAVHASLMVPASLSLHAEPGSALPPATPWQSITWPMHWHWAFQASFPVAALLSLQAVPGSALPPATPKQSTI